MNEITKSFIKDFKNLLDKYNAHLDKLDQYGGDEVFLGRMYSVVSNTEDKDFLYIEMDDLYEYF